MKYPGSNAIASSSAGATGSDSGVWRQFFSDVEGAELLTHRGYKFYVLDMFSETPGVWGSHPEALVLLIATRDGVPVCPLTDVNIGPLLHDPPGDDAYEMYTAVHARPHRYGLLLAHCPYAPGPIVQVEEHEFISCDIPTGNTAVCLSNQGRSKARVYPGHRPGSGLCITVVDEYGYTLSEYYVA